MDTFHNTFDNVNHIFLNKWFTLHYTYHMGSLFEYQIKWYYYNNNEFTLPRLGDG